MLDSFPALSAERLPVKLLAGFAEVALSVFNDGDVHIHRIFLDSLCFCFQLVSTNLLCNNLRSVSLYTMLRAMVHRYAGKLFSVSRLLRFSHIVMKLLWVMSLANDLSYTRRTMVLYSLALYFRTMLQRQIYCLLSTWLPIKYHFFLHIDSSYIYAF